MAGGICAADSFLLVSVFDCVGAALQTLTVQVLLWIIMFFNLNSLQSVFILCLMAVLLLVPPRVLRLVCHVRR